MQGTPGQEGELAVFWQMCASCRILSGSLESKISYSSISPFCVQKQGECLVKLESALFPPSLSQKHKLKIKAVGIFFPPIILFETDYASYVTRNSAVLEWKYNTVMEFSKGKNYETIFFLSPELQSRAKWAGYLKSKFMWELGEA